MSEIHIVGDEGDVEVWLDCEDSGVECDGLVVGVGPTRTESIDDAIEDLETALRALRKLRDVERTETAGVAHHPV